MRHSYTYSTLVNYEIALQFLLHFAGQSGRKQSLKSPLMPTSCTTSTSSGQVVNLTYNLPNDTSPGFLLSKPGGKTPIPLAGLTPVNPPSFAPNNSPTHPNPATPPMILAPAAPTLEQHILTEEELYNDETINGLYSPLPHLQFTGHAHNGFTATPLEEWIKHPNNLTLSSDTLLNSFHPPDNHSNPATPASIFSDTPLPSFSQANNSSEGLSIVSQFALPPLENTLDFESVDLEALPP